MNTSMNLQRISVDRLKPAKYNPRKDLKPGDPAYEKIRRSLHEFGYVDPVIWNEVTGNIVGGHQRYKVLTAEGATEIDCVVVHIENPQEEKALNIALNKAVGEWEPVALADLLNDLKLSGYDVDATGFDAAEIDDLFSRVHDKDVKDDDCDIDPEQIEPFVQPGDPEPKDVVLCRVWASAVDAGNQHYRAADVMNTEQVINFTIRYRRDVKPGMWVKFQDEKWIISTLGEYSFKKTYLGLKASIAKGVSG